MAIAYDNSSIGSGTGLTLTFSHTVSGNDRFLFVDTYDQIGASSLVTGITYAGVALTKIGTSVQTPTDRIISRWGLIAPATGANNVVVTASSSTFVYAFATSYTGVQQYGQPEVIASGTGSSVTTQSSTITTIAANALPVLFLKCTSASSPAAGTNSVLRRIAGNAIVSDPNTGVTTPGSFTMVTTFTASISDAYIIVSLSPSINPLSQKSNTNAAAILF